MSNIKISAHNKNSLTFVLLILFILCVSYYKYNYNYNIINIININYNKNLFFFLSGRFSSLPQDFYIIHSDPACPQSFIRCERCRIRTRDHGLSSLSTFKIKYCNSDNCYPENFKR